VATVTPIPTATPTTTSVPTITLATSTLSRPTPTYISTKPQLPTAKPNYYKVTKVIDGDTFKIQTDNREEDTIRLIGIDTPETVDPRKPVQCFGKEASTKAKELIEGKIVILDSDPTQGNKDKYNRLLRYVHLEDGTFVNIKLIEDGYAFEYTYNTPYKYRAEFKEAQKQAEANKRGLWADGVCPISTPKPTTKLISLPKPINTSVPQKPQIIINTKTSTGSYACNCSKNCDSMASCDEAYFQLNNCGCSKRDADSDGIPCETLCN